MWMTYSTGVGENGAASFREGLKKTVTLYCGTDLLAAGGDEEVSLGLQASSLGLLDERFRASHVLVRRVGAAADQTSTESCRPVVGFDGFLEGRKGR